MSSYRIVERQYFDGKATPTDKPWYMIQQRKLRIITRLFFWFQKHRWVTLYDGDGDYASTLRFRTRGEAMQAIIRMEAGIPSNGAIEKVTDEVSLS